jgi:hypothetical protein
LWFFGVCVVCLIVVVLGCESGQGREEDDRGEKVSLEQATGKSEENALSTENNQTTPAPPSPRPPDRPTNSQPNRISHLQRLRLRGRPPVDHLVQVELAVRAALDALLDRALGAQAVDVHGLGLADAMDARHGLQVPLGVPVAGWVFIDFLRAGGGAGRRFVFGGLVGVVVCVSPSRPDVFEEGVRLSPSSSRAFG